MNKNACAFWVRSPDLTPYAIMLKYLETFRHLNLSLRRCNRNVRIKILFMRMNKSIYGSCNIAHFGNKNVNLSKNIRSL